MSTVGEWIKNQKTKLQSEIKQLDSKIEDKQNELADLRARKQGLQDDLAEIKSDHEKLGLDKDEVS
jgi:predicted  nucleic acid-binding Zn-ribbon protein